MNNKKRTLVYSSEFGSMCNVCGAPKTSCVCRGKMKKEKNTNKSAPIQPSPKDGVVRVGRETKGRKGKGVTIITGLPQAGAELKALAKTLKQKCGSGGTVRDRLVEIQGDHRDALVILLEGMGYKVKKSGG